MNVAVFSSSFLAARTDACSDTHTAHANDRIWSFFFFIVAAFFVVVAVVEKEKRPNSIIFTCSSLAPLGKRKRR